MKLLGGGYRSTQVGGIQVEIFIKFIVPPVTIGIFVLYFVALGKNVSRTEKEHGRDMTDELNPFTGNRMPVDDEEDKSAKENHSDDDHKEDFK